MLLTFALCSTHCSLAARHRSCHGRRMKSLAILFLSISFSTLIHAQETAAEKEVWQQEQAYWRYVSSGDSKSFKTLWSDRFTGWPDDAPRPEDKSKIDVWKISDYKLTPLSVREHGNDTVITFYCARTIVDGKTTEERVTHTWQRENGQWHIVGGMSCYAHCEAPESNAR
jgi:hypothetical protein